MYYPSKSLSLLKGFFLETERPVLYNYADLKCDKVMFIQEELGNQCWL